MWMTTKDPSSPYHLRQLSNAPTSNNGPNELPCNGTELRPILDQDRQNYVTDVESDDRIGRDGSSSISERSGLESRLVHRAEENTGGKSQGEESHERRVWEKLRRYLVVCLLVLLITFSAAAYSLVGPFIPIEASEKGSNPVTTGIIIGASPFFLVTLSPVFGYYIPRLGVKFTLVSGILLVGGAFFLLGFLTYMPPGAVFVAFGIVLQSAEGVGWAMGKTTTLALLPYLYPSHVGLLAGLILGFEGVGYAIGPPIGSLLVSVSDYRVPFWTVGGILLMLIAPAFLLVKTTESLSTEVLPFRTMLKLLSRMSFSMLLLTNVTAYSSLTFMAVSLALYLKEIGLSQVIIGMMFGISAASYVVFAIPFGKLSDLFGTRKFIISGLFGESAALIFLGLTPYIPLPQKWMVASSLVVLGFSISQIDIPVYSDLLNQAHSLKLVDEDKKDALTCTVSGITAFSMSFGEFLGAIVGGLLTHLMDFPTAAMILGEAAGANAVLVLGVSLIDYTTSRKLVQKT